MNQPSSNPNDFKVVELHNSTDFDFTPDMGCMFDSRPISGVRIAAGIAAGETVMLPYHVGHRLAVNLAKAVLTRQAPKVDPQGVPTGVPLWSAERLEELKNSFLKDKYSEAKPIGMTETDRLMAKVEEYKQLVEKALAQPGAVPTAPAPTPAPATAPVAPAPSATDPVANTPEVKDPEVPKVVFQDKAEVIAELEKRNIQHDKRKSKADLEKLLN